MAGHQTRFLPCRNIQCYLALPVPFWPGRKLFCIVERRLLCFSVLPYCVYSVYGIFRCFLHTIVYARPGGYHYSCFHRHKQIRIPNCQNAGQLTDHPSTSIIRLCTSLGSQWPPMMRFMSSATWTKPWPAFLPSAMISSIRSSSDMLAAFFAMLIRTG